jgi:flagellar biosynthesis/type III secretory pathway protein FliH
MLQQRLHTMALVARSDAHPEQCADMREMTRLVITILGTVLGEMRQGTFGTDTRHTPETLRLIAEEQVAIAKQAIAAATMVTAFAEDSTAAEQYQQDATTELQHAIEDIAELQAQYMEQAEQEALAEAAQLGKEAARTTAIEEIMAVIRRLN